MHPAPSVIVFTTLSGLGFGFLAFLGLGLIRPTGWAAFFLYGLGYALAVGGLMASAFHLGRPERALRAFTQWRTSWLSREAWASAATLLILAPVALGAIFGFRVPVLGLLGAALCVVTILCTAMIYTQLKTVPRWNHWSTPALFLLFAFAGGAILSGQTVLAALACLILGAVLIYDFLAGNGRFATCGSTMETATGLGSIGDVRSFAKPHTGTDYLMREMIFHVGRKHAVKLRWIAVGFAAVAPALVLLSGLPPIPAVVIAAILHLIGAATARWLFFAEAEHVVGLYYGRR